jgi:hypothetical protein
VDDRSAFLVCKNLIRRPRQSHRLYHVQKSHIASTTCLCTLYCTANAHTASRCTATHLHRDSSLLNRYRSPETDRDYTNLSISFSEPPSSYTEMGKEISVHHDLDSNGTTPVPVKTTLNHHQQCCLHLSPVGFGSMI